MQFARLSIFGFCVFCLLRTHWIRQSADQIAGQYFGWTYNYFIYGILKGSTLA